MPTMIRRRQWHATDDELLTALIARFGCQRGPASESNWAHISRHLPGRTSKDCRKRWFYSLDPALRKGPWTAVEDQIIKDAYLRIGPAWKEIGMYARSVLTTPRGPVLHLNGLLSHLLSRALLMDKAVMLEGRNDDQVAKRYTEVLSPKSRHRLASWSATEDKILAEQVAILGHRWAAISATLPNRPPLTCRNRWRALSRRTKTRSDDQEQPSNYRPSSIEPQISNASLVASMASIPAMTSGAPTYFIHDTSTGAANTSDETSTGEDGTTCFPESDIAMSILPPTSRAQTPLHRLQHAVHARWASTSEFSPQQPDSRLACMRNIGNEFFNGACVPKEMGMHSLSPTSGLESANQDIDRSNWMESNISLELLANDDFGLPFLSSFKETNMAMDDMPESNLAADSTLSAPYSYQETQYLHNNSYPLSSDTSQSTGTTSLQGHAWDGGEIDRTQHSTSVARPELRQESNVAVHYHYHIQHNHYYHYYYHNKP